MKLNFVGINLAEKMTRLKGLRINSIKIKEEVKELWKD